MPNPGKILKTIAKYQPSVVGYRELSSVCYLGISLTNTLFRGQDFFEILNAIKEAKFGKLIVVVGDSLQRHNFLREAPGEKNPDEAMKEAYEAAIALGVKWREEKHQISISSESPDSPGSMLFSHVEMINQVFDNEGSVDIYNWDTFLSSIITLSISEGGMASVSVISSLDSPSLPSDTALSSDVSSSTTLKEATSFTGVRGLVDLLYHNCENKSGSFSDCIDSLANMMCLKSPKASKSYRVRLGHTLDYIKEELAVLVLFGMRNPHSVFVYPSTNIQDEAIKTIYKAFRLLLEGGDLDKTLLYTDHIKLDKSSIRVSPARHHPPLRATSSISSLPISRSTTRDKHLPVPIPGLGYHSDPESGLSLSPPTSSSQEIATLNTREPSEGEAVSPIASPRMASPRRVESESIPASSVAPSQSYLSSDAMAWPGMFGSRANRSIDTSFDAMLGHVKEIAVRGDFDSAKKILETVSFIKLQEVESGSTYKP